MRFYPSIDILRGFAALSVVMYHIIEHYPWRDFPTDYPLVWFRIGWMGVDLFFVISGFVITLSAFSLLRDDPASFPQRFAARRLARIVPLHYLTCLLFLIFCMPSLVFQGDGWLHVLTHLGFVHNLLPTTQGSLNGPNWSIGTEMQFYLLILLTAPFLLRWRPLLMAGVLVVIAWIWRAWMFWTLDPTAPNNAFMLFYATGQLPGTLDEFAWGILLARLIHDEAGARLRAWLAARPWLLPAAAAVSLYLCLVLYWRHAVYWNDWRMVVFWRTLLGFCFLLVVASACFLNAAWFVRLTAPLRYLGTISYGIYLWHLPVILALKTVPIGDNPLRFALHVVPLVLLLATVSWHYFERPFLRRYGSSRTGVSPLTLRAEPAGASPA